MEPFEQNFCSSLLNNCCHKIFQNFPEHGNQGEGAKFTRGQEPAIERFLEVKK